MTFHMRFVLSDLVLSYPTMRLNNAISSIYIFIILKGGVVMRSYMQCIYGGKKQEKKRAEPDGSARLDCSWAFASSLGFS